MKKITVIIPTRNRLEMLKRTLESIPQEDFISTIVVCDGDEDTFQYLIDNSVKNIMPVLMHKHQGTVFCRNIFTSTVEDGVICAMDSVIFNSDSIQRAFNIFNQNFLDDDGVYCFNFEGRGSCTALSLVGQKFLQRYDGKKLYYPPFFHFACQEISALCAHLEKEEKKKFIVDDNKFTVVKKVMYDKTYNDARKYRQEDHKFIEIRRKENDIWGFNK